MTCYHPLNAWRSSVPGVKSLNFKPSLSSVTQHLQIPCGRCIGCKLEYARQWGVRCLHEQKYHSESCFLTLTYDSEQLPDLGTLVPVHLDKFHKSLRNHVEYYYPFVPQLKWFACGEYGTRRQRPHYHSCIFGFDFFDKQKFKSLPSGEVLYISDTLQSLWPYGQATLGALTQASAEYTARYAAKKLTREEQEKKYQSLDLRTGEIGKLHEEFSRMSKGIGLRHYLQYGCSIYPVDSVVVGGRQAKPPRYYDKRLALDEPVTGFLVGMRRTYQSKKKEADNTPERLGVKEKVRKSKIKSLLRSYECE
ncbi:MAG: replication initiator protein [Microvirus sp.]|nr:MAG: replication initiator protein [Microvirus sp.]